MTDPIPNPPLPPLNGNMASNLMAVMVWMDGRLEATEKRVNDRIQAHEKDCADTLAPYERLAGAIGFVGSHPRFVTFAVSAVIGVLLLLGVFDADSVARWVPPF